MPRDRQQRANTNVILAAAIGDRREKTHHIEKKQKKSQMAKVTVWFRPAHIDRFDGDETIVVSIGLARAPRVYTFEARTAKEIRAKIDELGTQQHSVRAFVRLEGGARKPPGFDFLMRDLNYNLETRIC